MPSPDKHGSLTGPGLGGAAADARLMDRLRRFLEADDALEKIQKATRTGTTCVDTASRTPHWGRNAVPLIPEKAATESSATENGEDSIPIDGADLFSSASQGSKPAGADYAGSPLGSSRSSNGKAIGDFPAREVASPLPPLPAAAANISPWDGAAFRETGDEEGPRAQAPRVGMVGTLSKSSDAPARLATMRTPPRKVPMLGPGAEALPRDSATPLATRAVRSPPSNASQQEDLTEAIGKHIREKYGRPWPDMDSVHPGGEPSARSEGSGSQTISKWGSTGGSQGRTDKPKCSLSSSDLRIGVPMTHRGSPRGQSDKGALRYLDIPQTSLADFQEYAKSLINKASLECSEMNPYIRALCDHRRSMTEGVVDLWAEHVDSLEARLATQRCGALATLNIPPIKDRPRHGVFVDCVHAECALHHGAFQFSPGREDTKEIHALEANSSSSSTTAGTSAGVVERPL